MATLASASLALAEDVYVSPKIFDGVLIVSTCQDLQPQQTELLTAECQTANVPDQLVVVQANGEQATSALKALNEIKWTSPPLRLSFSGEATGTEIESLQKLASGDCLWIDAEQLQLGGATLVTALQECLARGALVYLDAKKIANGQSIDAIRSLLGQMRLVRLKEREGESARDALNAGAISYEENSLLIGVPESCWLRIGGRAIMNLSSEPTADCLLYWPATKHYKEGLDKRLPVGTVADLVTYRRAWFERQQVEFPADTEYQPKLNKGSLVIVGGGRTAPEIWQKFVELAGGSKSRIVILPTAMPNPTIEDADERQIFMRHGAGEVRVLPQIDRDSVSSSAFLDELRWATGIWFGGGRQWRFVDAYWGTPAWEEIKQVLERDGVIGGSSAGATIQGDLLVRGHPLGNQIMVADGYRRGLGLLSGVAIDQHFRQRNRFDDLKAVVERFPKIVGVGIDEGTALIVTPTDKCHVLGEGSVWITTPAHREYIEYESGAEFQLK